MWLVYAVNFITTGFLLCQNFIKNKEQGFILFINVATHLPVNIPDNPALAFFLRLGWMQTLVNHQLF